MAIDRATQFDGGPQLQLVHKLSNWSSSIREIRRRSRVEGGPHHGLAMPQAASAMRVMSAAPAR